MSQKKNNGKQTVKSQQGITKRTRKPSTKDECNDIGEELQLKITKWYKKCSNNTCETIIYYSRSDGLARAKYENTECRKCSNNKLGPLGYRWKGYNELSKTKFTAIQYGALERHHEFDITMQQMYDAFIEQQQICKLSGVGLPDINKASLDRIDSTKGYTIDNIQWTNKYVNYMKRDMTDEEFWNWCIVIADFARSSANKKPFDIRSPLD